MAQDVSPDLMGTCVSGQSGGGGTLRKAFRSVLAPMRDRFTLLDGDHEIVPGIEAQLAPGHVVVRVGGRMVYTGDSFLRAPNVSHPDWTVTFDLWPDQVRETRRRLLRQWASENALIVTTHFPMPGIGRIRAEATGWACPCYRGTVAPVSPKASRAGTSSRLLPLAEHVFVHEEGAE